MCYFRPLRPATCQSVRMDFLALVPGVHTIDVLTLTDVESGFAMNLRCANLFFKSWKLSDAIYNPSRFLDLLWISLCTSLTTEEYTCSHRCSARYLYCV